ncbi:unnamed protein product [Fraxinus pennsylvanica]|uniref:Uncharacterized protein n=1 Tax=Fraxinus pennsylvanica TaxID=56036 RepID=A0AAD1ZM27_9LAMI|nr:unnamed protein product [Fraxinus pennsylvanica]
MFVAIPHVTILRSLTRLPLQFVVSVQGLNMPSLKPGGEKHVNASKILKISRRRGSANWSIEVLVDGQLSGLKLEAKHFLDYVLITFDFQIIENGKYMLVAEGVKDEKIDMFYRIGLYYLSTQLSPLLGLPLALGLTPKAEGRYLRVSVCRDERLIVEDGRSDLINDLGLPV